MMLAPPTWDEESLESGRAKAVEVFRHKRIEEPLEEYLEAFDEYQGTIEYLLEATVDLGQVADHALDIAVDRKLLEALRYLAGPPVSEDDLKTLAEVVLSPKRLQADPDMAGRIVGVVMNGLDRRRFTWVAENREPSEAERDAAVLASAALMAVRRVQTARRNYAKADQEDHVEEQLLAAGLQRVDRRTVNTLSDAPRKGEFCLESKLGTRKADLILGLYDGRVMPIECKVSNSSTNSVKRLNNDAAVKAEHWKQDFGALQVVPTAVLSGVFKLHNLQEAQGRGLTLFWDHDLAPLVDWILRTKG